MMTTAQLLSWLHNAGADTCQHGDRFTIPIQAADGTVNACYVCVCCAIDDPPPYQATDDQNAAIAWLEAAGEIAGVEVDAAAIDGTAYDPCGNDSNHGPGVVCTKDGYLCLGCAVAWLSWHAGELVSPEVLRQRPSSVVAA